MKYTEEKLWEYIDEDVTPAELADFRKACAADEALARKYSDLLKMHEMFKKHIGLPDVKKSADRAPKLKNTMEEANEFSVLRNIAFSLS